MNAFFWEESCNSLLDYAFFFFTFVVVVCNSAFSRSFYIA